MSKPRVYLFLLGGFFVFSLNLPIHSQSTNPLAAYRAGIAALDQERPYEAVESFKEALRGNPKYLDAMIGLAQVYYYLDEYDEALRYVNMAAPYGKDNSSLLNIQGRVLLALGKTVEASTLFQLVLAKEPFNVDALLGLAEFSLSKGDELNALQQYLKSVQYKPQDRRILLSLSLMYEERGDKKRAETYLMKALDVYSESPLVQAMASEFFLRNQDYAQAEFHAQTALSMYSGYKKALQLLGNVYLRSARNSEALAAMDQLIKLYPEDTTAWYTRGMALLNLSRFDEALACFEKVLNLSPNDEISRIIMEDAVITNLKSEDPKRTRYAAYHFDQAIQFAKKNLNERAAYHFNRGILLAPQDPKGREQYAVFLKNAGEKSLLLQELKVLQKLGVNNNFVRDNLEIYESLLSSSVSSSWNVDQFTVKRDPLLFRLYYLPGQQNLEHPLAEPYLARYVKGMLSVSPKLSFARDREEFSPSTEPQRVTSEAQAFSMARQEGVDYYLLMSLGESLDNFQIKSTLHLGRTSTVLQTYGAFRTGNFRVQNAVYQIADTVAKELPLRGRLLKRNFNDGLINLGFSDGLKAGDVLHIVGADSYILRGDKPGFSFSQEKKLGSFTVVSSDDLVSSGAVQREGFFDRINTGDVILRDGESQIKTVEASARFPYLYNKIRSLR